MKVKDAAGSERSHRSIVGKMALVVVGMFGFGYALVPLYDVFCEVTGLGGRTGVVEEQTAATLEVDRDRTVTVQFLASVNGNLPWDFAPRVKTMEVHPGEMAEASYVAQNRASKTVVGQALPSMSPTRASKYFSKVECFCFNNQPLDPGQEMEMPIRFVVDPALPKEISTVTLSYTFFDTGNVAVN